MSMRTCVIFNPAARGEKAARFRQHLAEISTQCTLKPTYAAGAGRALGAEAAKEGFEIIVAAGGDGTVNEVLNGIGDVPEALARVRFAVMPLGTVNVFAKELRMPTGFTAAWNVILQGRETTIDLPEAEYSAGGKPQTRFFAQMAGAGLDSRAIDLVDFQLKKKIGGLAYVMAGLKALKGPLPQIVATDGKETHQGELVLIGNGRFYGGKYPLFPLADLRDGLLEVSVFPKVNFQGFMRAGWGLLLNQLYSSGGAKHFKAESIQLYSSLPVLFHVEGENTGQLPAKFSIRRNALRVVVP
ncbi:MAG: YegS/Rv2252/BmrU family lipid kinase [Verrucomicrobiales bacterium]|nr:YegS/Rv2252/BmrU family lipid kinase [Verrucomicrobiales bacterium]